MSDLPRRDPQHLEPLRSLGGAPRRRSARGSTALAPDILGPAGGLRLEPDDGDGLDQADGDRRGLRLPRRPTRARATSAGSATRCSRAGPSRGATSTSCPACGTDERRTLLFAEIDVALRRASRSSSRTSTGSSTRGTCVRRRCARSSRRIEALADGRGRLPRRPRRRHERRARLRRDPLPPRADVARRRPARLLPGRLRVRGRRRGGRHLRAAQPVRRAAARARPPHRLRLRPRPRRAPPGRAASRHGSASTSRSTAHSPATTSASSRRCGEARTCVAGGPVVFGAEALERVRHWNPVRLSGLRGPSADPAAGGEILLSRE